jgi:bifunctional non-homologous end joining protein LigD
VKADRRRTVRRSCVDDARRFRELAAAVRALPVPTLVLDGQFVVFDQHLGSHFELLRGPAADIVHTPSVCIAFDVLYRNGIDLTDRPLHERRVQLEDLVAGGDIRETAEQ